MIQVADNFNYRGKKPNFDRDSFDTLQDMKNYSENSLDDGHISYRPTNVLVGFQYFDTTINKPIFWDGSKWIDATGATV